MNRLATAAVATNSIVTGFSSVRKASASVTKHEIRTALVGTRRGGVGRGALAAPDAL